MFTRHQSGIQRTGVAEVSRPLLSSRTFAGFDDLRHTDVDGAADVRAALKLFPDFLYFHIAFEGVLGGPRRSLGGPRRSLEVPVELLGSDRLL